MNKLATLMLVTLLCCMVKTIDAQQAEICGTMAADAKISQKDADYDSRRESIEEFTQQYIQRQQNNGMRAVEPIVTIPVVVHILYDNGSQNLSDAIINSQIAVLNEDFRRLNADANQTRSAFAGIAADVQIEFCLANRDPQGNATTGITRTSTNSAPFNSGNNNMKFTTLGGIDAWPANSYLNIWVCELSSNVLGFAYFPGAPANIDGVVVDYQTFGSIGGHLLSGYQDGRITTHEVGHYLNLYHVFQSGCSGTTAATCSNSGDRVCDTPPQSVEHFGCPSNTPNTCTESPTDQVDQYENYMDYTFDYCKNMFSQGQAARMQALFTAGGVRSGLLNSLGCAGSIACTSGVALPVAEDFEGAFVPSDWILENPDASDTWQKRSNVTGATGSSTSAAWINNFAYNAAGQEDDLAVFPIDLTLNASASVSFDVAYARYSSTYSDGLRVDVSIDCGNSYDFTAYNKSGTVLATVSDQTTTWAPSNASHWRNEVIDLTPYVGNYITVRFTGINGFGNNLYLDNVNITGVALPCDAPLNPTVINLTNNSATLAWNDVPAANSYEIRGRPLGTTSWINLAVSTNSFNVSGIGGNIYEWQVRAICDNGNSVSTYSELDTFGVGCLYPDAHFTSAVTSTTAMLNWTPIAGVSIYTIQGRIVGTSGLVSLGVLGAATSFPVSGLSPGTAYEWQIRTNCNLIGSSAYSPYTTFVTDGLKPQTSSSISTFGNINATHLQVYPNPVKDVLTIRMEGVELDDAELHLLNSLGQVIHSESVTGDQMHNHRVNVRDLSTGVYFVRVRSGSTEELVRFLVY